MSVEGNFLHASTNEAMGKQGFHPHVDGTTVKQRPEEPEVPLKPQWPLRSRPQVAFTVKEVIAFGCLNGLKLTAGLPRH